MVAVKDTNNKKKIAALLDDLLLLENYARDLFSFAPLPICFVSPVGVILEVNPAFERISGYSVYEIVGEPVEKILKKEKISQIAKETLEKDFSQGEEIGLITKEKKEILVSAFTQLRKTPRGENIGYFLALFDLTGVRKAEIALEETQTALLNMLEDVEEARRRAEEEKNKTLTIIANFADGLLVFDKENKLFLINPRAEVFFDVKARDLAGRPVLELITFPTLEPLIKLLGGEIKGVFRKELPIKENLTLEVSTIPMMSGEERLGNLVILHDITREKMIERMKTEFVSLSAHQLRTPLSAIKWTLRMLLDGDLGEITKEQREFIEKTYSSNERMITLINDLLDVTRIEEGRYLYKPTLTDFEPIVQFVVNSYREEAAKKGLKLEFKKSEKKLPKIMIDVEKIRLALDNLLDNAIRYTPPGGQTLVSLKAGKKGIEFSVKDTGVGIPKDQQQRVFAKFFRGANVMRMATEGSGLGLFITKNIIEAHGGEIWFESEEGKGTTFYFTLPVEKGFAEFLKEF